MLGRSSPHAATTEYREVFMGSRGFPTAVIMDNAEDEEQRAELNILASP